MVSENSGFILKEILESLCCNNGWCYGVFWSFSQQNSLLLTLQDGHFEDKLGALIDDMLLQVHMLGEGVIGRAAFTMKHQFIFSDAQTNKQNCTESIEGFEVYQDNYEMFSQFSAGIKTISVIPVENFGVVQFGSFQKLPETMEFVEQTKSIFSEMANGGQPVREDRSLSSSSEILSSNGVFASLISSDNSWSANCGYLHGSGEEQLMEASLPLPNLIFPFPSTSFDERIEAIDNSCLSNIQLEPSFVPSATSVNNAIDIAPCSSLWSSEDSAQTSFLQPFPSQTGSIDSHATTIGKGGGFRYVNNSQDSNNPLFCTMDWFNNMESDHWLYSSDGKLQGSADQHFYGELFRENDISNKLPQLLSTMQETDQLNNLSQKDTNFLSSSWKEHTRKASECNPSTSFESSISNVFSTVKNNKRSAMSGIGNLLGYPGEDSGCRSEHFSNSISRGHGDDSGIGSKCISRPTNKLFSSLGISHLLDDVSSSSCSVAKSSIEDQLSSANKRRKIETPLLRTDAERLSSLATSGPKTNIINSIYNPNTTTNVGSKRDATHRPLSDSSVCDSFSIHGGKVSQHQQPEKHAKNAKKKSKPGMRPRPKDRQQIHDRLLELRKLIPNAEKMSIDGLLHRTIKHLLFLQSVTEHAESIKQLTDSEQDRIAPQDIPCTRDSGVTWACEVGDQTMAFPLIVEDLNTPGHMSIEIQCEEHDSFLEIVDIIQSFGLTILKGVMEARKAKMCARFTVATEGENHVTRHEIFSSLVQLLKFTGSSNASPLEQCNDVASRGGELFNTSQQSAIQLPV